MGLIGFFSRHHQRNKLHFQILQDSVTQNNLISLRHLAVGFEIFLLLYGVLAARLFQTPLLNNLYLLFLAVNCLLMFLAFCGEHILPHTFRTVQILCLSAVIEVMAFDICISVFPFPERPAIFFPLAYTVMIVIFHFHAWQTLALFSAMTALFIWLVFVFKTPRA